MYRLGKRKQKSHGTLIIPTIVVVLLLVLGALYALTHLPIQTATTTHNSPPSVHYVPASSTQKAHLDEGLFSVDLPAGWKLIDHQVTPYKLYSFQGTGTNAGTQRIDVYVDGSPAGYAVNHVVAIQSQGSSISYSEASDNCINFASDAARKDPTAQKQGFTVSRWQGVDFYCDIKNTSRDYAGTSSPDGINRIVLSGPKEGTHSYFFAYLDTNINIDYSVLYDTLDSFQAE